MRTMLSYLYKVRPSLAGMIHSVPTKNSYGCKNFFKSSVTYYISKYYILLHQQTAVGFTNKHKKQQQQMNSFTSGQELMLSINFIMPCCLCIGLTLVCAAMSYKTTSKLLYYFNVKNTAVTFFFLMGSLKTPYCNVFSKLLRFFVSNDRITNLHNSEVLPDCICKSCDVAQFRYQANQSWLFTLTGNK